MDQGWMSHWSKAPIRADEGVDLGALHIVELLHSVLDLGLGGLDIHQKHQSVDLLNLLPGWCGTCPVCPLETPRTFEGICHSWPGGWAMHPKRENIGVSWDLHHEKGCNSSKQWMKYDETTNHWPFPRSWACRSEPWFGSSSPQQGRHARGPSCFSNPFSGNLWRPHGNQYPINFIKMWNCSQRLGFAVRDFCLSGPSAWKITEILAPPWVPRPKENDNNNPSMSQQFAFTQAYHDFMPEFQSHWSALNA